MTQRIEPVGPRTGTQSVSAPVLLTPVEREAERRRREQERKRRRAASPAPSEEPSEAPRQGSVLDIRG